MSNAHINAEGLYTDFIAVPWVSAWGAFIDSFVALTSAILTD